MPEIAALTQTPAEVQANKVPNFHVLLVRYIGATNYRSARFKVRSDRFKESIVINWPYDSPLNSAVRVAAAWLIANGWKVVGIAEGGRDDYIITSTFDRLPRPARAKGVTGAKRKAPRKAARKVARRRRR